MSLYDFKVLINVFVHNSPMKLQVKYKLLMDDW